jgi:hypothetical protein
MLSSRRGRPTRTSLAFADVLWFFDEATLDNMLYETKRFLEVAVVDDVEPEAIHQIEAVRDALEAELNSNRFELDGPELSDPLISHDREYAVEGLALDDGPGEAVHKGY